MVENEETPWETTLADMRSMATELETAGWRTLSIVAGDTAPVSPADGPKADDRLGLVHVVQGIDADGLEEVVERCTLSRSEAYFAVVDGTEYVVTVVRDPDERQAVLLAGAFDYRQAGDCFAAAIREDRIATYIQRLDGTQVAVFEHDDPTLFEPEQESTP